MSSKRASLRPAVPLALLGCLIIAAPVSAVNPKTVRVSVSSAGVQGNGRSYGASISDDGRYIAFTSTASNLGAGQADGFIAPSDVFRRGPLH